MQGKSIQFDNGTYQTDDPQEIELIKQLDTYGTEIFSGEAGEPSIPSTAAIKRKNTEQAAVPDPTGCPKCSFKAQSKAGLLSHMRFRHSGGEGSPSGSRPPTDIDDLLPRE